MNSLYNVAINNIALVTEILKMGKVHIEDVWLTTHDIPNVGNAIIM